MKLTYLAALLMLLTLGCAGEGSSTPATDGGATTAPAPDTDATSSSATVSDGELTKVSLTVEGMR